MANSNHKYKYQWLKLDLNIFKTIEFAALHDSSANGPLFADIWMRLVVFAANNDGLLCKINGDRKVDLSDDDIVIKANSTQFTTKFAHEAIDVLQAANLIYRNSEGLLAITGLYFTGDPKEPVLNFEDGTPIRPVTIGESLSYVAKRPLRSRTA